MQSFEVTPSSVTASPSAQRTAEEVAVRPVAAQQALATENSAADLMARRQALLEAMRQKELARKEAREREAEQLLLRHQKEREQERARTDAENARRRAREEAEAAKLFADEVRRAKAAAAAAAVAAAASRPVPSSVEPQPAAVPVLTRSPSSPLLSSSASRIALASAPVPIPVISSRAPPIPMGAPPPAALLRAPVVHFAAPSEAWLSKEMDSAATLNINTMPHGDALLEALRDAEENRDQRDSQDAPPPTVAPTVAPPALVPVMATAETAETGAIDDNDNDRDSDAPSQSESVVDVADGDTSTATAPDASLPMSVSTAERLAREFASRNRLTADMELERAKREENKAAARRAMEMVFTAKLKRVVRAPAPLRDDMFQRLPTLPAVDSNQSRPVPKLFLDLAPPEDAAVPDVRGAKAPADAAGDAPATTATSPHSRGPVEPPRKALPPAPPSHEAPLALSPRLDADVYVSKALPPPPPDDDEDGLGGESERVAELRRQVASLQQQLRSRCCFACGAKLSCARCTASKPAPRRQLPSPWTRAVAEGSLG